MGPFVTRALRDDEREWALERIREAWADEIVVGRGRVRKRLRVMTTNDNARALRFYQRNGMRLVDLRAGEVERGRRLKPAIPETGEDGIPIRDEIDLELPLR